MTDKKRFDIEFEGVGTCTGKMRNDIAVDFKTMNERYDLATDEGAFHGGGGTAPPPLALFTAALIGCVMTQIRAFSKRLKIPIGEVEVRARLHWEGHQTGRDPYVTAPVGFSLDIDLDSEASVEEQHHLIDAAKQGCFIEQTLKQGVEVAHRVKIEDGWQDA
jgi:uncharacterized OsmC-like protein